MFKNSFVLTFTGLAIEVMIGAQIVAGIEVGIVAGIEAGIGAGIGIRKEAIMIQTGIQEVGIGLVIAAGILTRKEAIMIQTEIVKEIVRLQAATANLKGDFKKLKINATF